MTSVAQGAELRISVEAGADLTGLQGYFLQWSGSTVVVCSAVTDEPAGVLQDDDVVAGRMAEMVVLGPTLVSADAAIVAGAFIGPSADGQAETKVPGTDVTEYVAGRAFEAAAAAGNLIHAVVNCVTPHRAA